MVSIHVHTVKQLDPLKFQHGHSRLWKTQAALQQMLWRQDLQPMNCFIFNSPTFRVRVAYYKLMRDYHDFCRPIRQRIGFCLNLRIYELAVIWANFISVTYTHLWAKERSGYWLCEITAFAGGYSSRFVKRGCLRQHILGVQPVNRPQM